MARRKSEEVVEETTKVEDNSEAVVNEVQEVKSEEVTIEPINEDNSEVIDNAEESELKSEVDISEVTEPIKEFETKNEDLNENEATTDTIKEEITTNKVINSNKGFKRYLHNKRHSIY